MSEIGWAAVHAGKRGWLGTAKLDRIKANYPMLFVRTKTARGIKNQAFTLPEIIDDDKFMKAVYGDEQECNCENIGCNQRDKDRCGDHRLHTNLPLYRYIQQQAIIRNGDEQIQFLYDKMREGR
jgi:hypothetical protein